MREGLGVWVGALMMSAENILDSVYLGFIIVIESCGDTCTQASSPNIVIQDSPAPCVYAEPDIHKLQPLRAASDSVIAKRMLRGVYSMKTTKIIHRKLDALSVLLFLCATHGSGRIGNCMWGQNVQQFVRMFECSGSFEMSKQF